MDMSVNSSLLFFPYSPVVNLINHDSVRPNAKLQWSESALHYGQERLDLPLDKFKSLQRTGLLLEIVATRDIEPGEEIFLNYGANWDAAWKKHKAGWKPVSHEHYKYPYLLDKELKYSELITESDDRSTNQYPSNVQTSCFYSYGDHVQDAGDSTSTSPMIWHLTPNTAKTQSGRPCRLLSKERDEQGALWYTTEMLNWGDAQGPDHVPKGHIVTHIPRNAIALNSKQYTSDMHLPNAFRHMIEIANEIVPNQRMDLL